jgi:orotate phosphoribosyltransferase
LHSTVYLQCALVLQFPERAESFGRAIAEKYRDAGIQLVASPAIGGIVIGHEVARALGARFVWTERDAGEMTLRRGFTVSPGEKTLVVEDVITTGGSTRETIEALKRAGAEVIGAASIIDRSAGAADVGVPLTALASLKVLSVTAAECDACKLGEPVVKPGSRKDTVSITTR